MLNYQRVSYNHSNHWSPTLQRGVTSATGPQSQAASCLGSEHLRRWNQCLEAQGPIGCGSKFTALKTTEISSSLYILPGFVWKLRAKNRRIPWFIMIFRHEMDGTSRNRVDRVFRFRHRIVQVCYYIDLWNPISNMIMSHMMWGPLAICWFITPSNYTYKYHKP